MSLQNTAAVHRGMIHKPANLNCMVKFVLKSVFNAFLIGLLVLQATSSFSQNPMGNLKNLPDKPWELDQLAVPWLPFEEDWSSGNLEANEWITAGTNWQIAGQTGNAAPSAEFHYSPAITNYQNGLTSRWLSGRNLLDGEIYLTFDLKLASVNNTGLEVLKYQVFTDTSWVTVAADSNAFGFDWIAKKIDLTALVKGKIFKIRFLAEGRNSLDIFNWMIDNISVYRKCEPPFNLVVNYDWPNVYAFHLDWEAPDGGAHIDPAWIAWDDGINSDAIGLAGGGTFSVAVRFTPDQLAGYAGTSLTKMRIFTKAAGGTIVLKVWTGANASHPELIQPVSSYIPFAWNEFILNTPVAVSGTAELWFGYTVTHDLEYVAGRDAGPAVVGFGDMISTDNVIWESMATAYNLNYNWNIEGYVELANRNSGYLSTGDHMESQNKNQKSDNSLGNSCRTGRNLLYYEVFRDNEYRDTTSNTFYVDNNVNYLTWNCYFVKAVYQDCVSDISNEECLGPVKEYKTNSLLFYPVPASQTLTIEPTAELISLCIYDCSFYPVYRTGNLRQGSISVNTSAFRNGIYLLRAVDKSGKVYTDKFIVQH